MKTMALLMLLVITAFCFLSASCSGKEGDQKRGPRNVHMTAELDVTADAVYFLSHEQKDGYRKIIYYDKKSGQSGILCGKPECTHDTPDCNAIPADKMGAPFGLRVLKNKIYWIADKMSGGLLDGRSLYRMNPDGTGREEVRTLLPEEQRNRMISGSRYADYTDDYVIVGGGIGTIESGTFKQTLLLRAYSLSDPGKDLVILDEENTGTLYFCISGNEVYYSITSQRARGENESWKQDTRLRLFRYDLKKGSQEELFDAEVPFTLWNFCPDGERIAISAANDSDHPNEGYILDLGTKEISKSIPMDEHGGSYFSEIDGGRLISWTFPLGDPSVYRLLVKDFDGNVISDHTAANEMESSGELARRRVLEGSDEEFLYYSFTDGIAPQEVQWLMAYPAKGGEPELLWTDAEEVPGHKEPGDREPAEDSGTKEGQPDGPGRETGETQSEEPGTEAEYTFRIRVEINAEKIGDDYYLDSMEDLAKTEFCFWMENGTDDSILDYSHELYRRNAGSGLFTKVYSEGSGHGTNISPKNKQKNEGNLGNVLMAYHFENGMSALRFKAKGMLNGKEVTAETEVRIFIRSEMN